MDFGVQNPMLARLMNKKEMCFYEKTHLFSNIIIAEIIF